MSAPLGALARGTTALVTGASRGFGFEIARRLCREGCQVIGVARDRAALEESTGRLREEGGKAIGIPADVSRVEDVEQVFHEVRRHFGTLSAVVNCAGIPGPYGPVGVAGVQPWWETIEVHVRGALHTMSLALPMMMSQGSGRIINIVSPAGTKVFAGLSAYCVAKSALIRLTEHVAAESKDHAIFAFAVDPGIVHTKLTEDTLSSPDAQKWVPHFVSFMRRISETQDRAVGMARCSERCIALLSGRFDGMSGRYLPIDQDLVVTESAS
jgi:NAD(P)-dependent dehydrogenase (short-subunit alcohol dehydrogenase family)